MNNRSLAPLSGVVFILLTAIAFVVLGGDTPTIDDSAETIGSYYADHSVREFLSSAVVALGTVFLAISSSPFARG